MLKRRRRAAWSREATVRGGSHGDAVRMALGVITDLYGILVERYPESLIESCGLSPESWRRAAATSAGKHPW